MCFICVCVRTDLDYYFYFCKTGCLLSLRTVPTNTEVYDYAGKAGLNKGYEKWKLRVATHFLEIIRQQLF